MENEAAQSNEVKEGAQSTASPAVNGNQGQHASSGAQDARPSNSQENLPFDKHPRFQEITRQNRQFKQELESLRRESQEQKAYMDAFRRQSGPQAPQIDANTLNGVKELFQLSLSHPEVKQMLVEGLGLKDIGQLREQLGQLSESWHGSQFKSELRGVLDQVKTLGIDTQEVEDQIKDAIENDPVYSQIGYQPGAVQAIFRNLYWDRVGELRERAENQKKIEQREALKRGQAQTTSDSHAKGSKVLSQDPGERMKQMIAEAGGLGNIDFAR